ncbi:MAG: hypothetical protein K6C36_08065 [Clostridia bacterium]|nr:hypothetical protein [Clostridia bacterium]
MKKIRIITVSVVALIIIVAVSIGVGANRQKILSPEEEVKFTDVQTQELIDSVRTAESSEELDLNIYGALIDRVSELKVDEYVFLLENNLDSDTVTKALISAATDGKIVIPDEILDTIFQSDLDFNVRLEALFYCASSEKDYSDTYIKLADDPELASFALRQLYTENPDTAMEIVRETIASYDGNYSIKLQGALHVMPDYLKKQGTDGEIAEYIALCEDIINGCKKDDEAVRSILLDLIGQIDSRQSLEYVVGNDEFIAKSSLVLYNQNTLRTILTNEPDEKSIDLALTCIAEDPADLLMDLLVENLEEHDEFYSAHPELYEKANRIVTDAYGY